MLKERNYQADGDICLSAENIKTEDLAEAVCHMRNRVSVEAPLIHCITNPISIHDCANVVLAAGGRPMMAEHPAEVAEITATARALALNLGNITDARKESIYIAGKTAMSEGIPVIMDMVGIGCSAFRKNILEAFLNERVSQAPLVLKGNMSELKTLAGVQKSVSGVDVNPEDVLCEKNLAETAALAQNVACQYEAVILASGKRDLITDGKRTFLVDNGSEMMGKITGTGCMLNVLTAAFLSAGEPLLAALGACVTFGISGEKAAARCKGTGSFQTAFLDDLYLISDEDIYRKIRVEPVLV